MLQLRLMRIARRMTIFDLARKTGVATSTLSMVERGLVALPEKDKLRIARVFNADPARLFAEVVPDKEAFGEVASAGAR